MAEAAADTSKGGMSKADMILSKLDSMTGRMDSIEKKADEALADAKSRKDGDLALEVKKNENEPVVGEKTPVKVESDKKKDSAEADAKGRKDGGGGFQNEGKEGQDPPKDKDWDKKDSKGKADAAKRADRDKDEDTSVSNVTKGSGDSAAADAKAKADWDDDDKDKDDSKDKKADARADALQTMAERLAALEAERNMPEESRHAYADTQGHWDGVAQMFGKQAPRWLTGETLGAYDRRLATMFRPYSQAWADVKMSELPDGAFRNARQQIYSDAMEAARNPTDLADGEERKIVKIDPDTGMRQIIWQGKESFIKGLGRPGRRVVSFLNRADAR